MAYLNKVLLIGNLGKDPEIRVTQNGQKQAKFTFATSEKFKDRTTGESRDRTEWHNIVAWRTSAEQIEKLGIHKGTSLYIEGRIIYRSWDDPSGQKKYMTEIEMDRFQILTSRAAGDRPQGAYAPQGQYAPQPGNSNAAPQYSAPQYDAPAPDYDSAGADDLPF